LPIPDFNSNMDVGSIETRDRLTELADLKRQLGILCHDYSRLMSAVRIVLEDMRHGNYLLVMPSDMEKRIDWWAGTLDSALRPLE
jgi:hypothetical protein